VPFERPFRFFIFIPELVSMCSLTLWLAGDICQAIPPWNTAPL
jgi:hypothetical protein